MSKRFIYYLTHDHFPDAQSLQEGPDTRVFYVGHTDNPEQRKRSHQARIKSGTEDLYQYFRNVIVPKGLDWDLVVWKEVDNSDKRPWEYLAVITAVANGADLQNMRFGVKVSGEVAREVRSERPDIQGVDDIDKLESHLRERKRKNAKVTQHRPGEASENMQLRVILKQLRRRSDHDYIRDLGDQKITMFGWDLGDGTEVFHAERFMRKIEIARMMTPRAIGELEALQAQAEAQ